MESISRYVMKLSYVGTNYSGWQIQDNAKSIQGDIMKGLHHILDPDIPLIVGAGRTDAGVHAVNFFAHFDYNKHIDGKDLTHKLNRFLSDDIVIHYITIVLSDFHARFSAKSRRYEYWVSSFKDPFLINRSYYLSQEIDFELMNHGAKMLLGEHDFSSFSKSKTDNNNCIVKSANWITSKNMLIFSIEANRFLYNMVRCVVGTLIDLGHHKIDIDDFTEIMTSRQRCRAGYSVPAYGLYLMDMKYPKKYNIEVI